MKNLILTITLCLIAMPAFAGVVVMSTPLPDPLAAEYPKVMHCPNAREEIIICPKPTAGEHNCVRLKSTNEGLLFGKFAPGWNPEAEGCVDEPGIVTLENAE